MQQINFTKMHGLGNDFIVVDATSQKVLLEKIPIQQLADRHLGIGFDQLLLIEASKNADFSCRIFNGDGSEAEQCGNGMRCVARFIHEKKLNPHKTLAIETQAGVMLVTIQDFNHIEVNMGRPQFESLCEITVDGQSIPLSVLSMGNPHVILEVESIINSPVADLGEKISKHSQFPHGTNVGFMEIISRQHIRLRTFERGAGETLACGSNSCAAVIAGIKSNLLDQKVKVELQLGNLWIEWGGDNEAVLMSGPAAHVFDGSIRTPT